MIDFDARNASPMLIAKEQTAFDDDDYIFEWKLDGIRCLLYLDDTTCELRNKRNLKLNDMFPELMDLHRQMNKRCILDGELYIFHNGKPDFFEVQKRALLRDPFKIHLHAKALPANYTAFDIVYYDNKAVIDKPLMKRKQLLKTAIVENERLSISRYIEAYGTQLFALTKQHDLEGIVAKRKDSLYVCGKRTKEWIKCKHLLDDDFIICGYIPKEKGIVSLIMAQYDKQSIVYKGHVTMGASLSYLLAHSQKTDTSVLPSVPNGHDDAIWITPPLVATVKFMEYTQQGGLRQPVFQCFRDDKDIQECVVSHI